MLDRDDFSLAIVEAEGGRVEGRTRLQKIAYLVTELLNDADLEATLGFVAHYYGPYSSALTATLQAQASRGLLEESLERYSSGGFPGDDLELRRYVYQRLPKGDEASEWRRKRKASEFERAVKAARKVVDTGGDYQALSWAAKLHLILKHERKAMRLDVAQERAQALGWKLSADELKTALAVLLKLGLIQESQKP